MKSVIIIVNIVLLIMFVIGVILTATGISMTFSDMNDDVANHAITPHLLVNFDNWNSSDRSFS